VALEKGEVIEAVKDIVHVVGEAHRRQ
jgi:hypothetical protein